MASLPSLIGLTPEEINELVNERPGSFRGAQIFKWIYQGVTDFDEMTNVSKELRAELRTKNALYTTEISQTLKDPDGTVKLQITLHDGGCIETVLLTDAEGRKTACVSCQVGCPMGCAFCQTGTLGFARNLTAGEIIEQFLHLEHICGTLQNIVFMGMGEPMLNLDNIRKAISILSSPKGRNLSTRRITISTSGVIKGIYDMADNGPNVRLAVSLTAADPELRTKLMPVNVANPLPELSKAIGYWMEKTGNRCTLEAALLHNVNTTRESALAMKKFVGNMPVHINIIPWNPVNSLPYEEPSRNEVRNYLNMLEELGLTVTQRTRRGRKIGGACGQLGKALHTEDE